MKILHMDGFDDAERASFRTIIRKNILHSFETILRACDQLDINVQTENEVFPQLYSQLTNIPTNINNTAYSIKVFERWDR